MTAADALAVCAMLGRAGVRFWLDGGWGVDALLDRETREHDDLDLALAVDDLAAFESAVGPAGFAEAYRDGPFNPVYADAAGRRIDVHLVDIASEVMDDGGTRVYGGRGLPYEIGALEGSGRILGTPVPCCTVEFQVRSHTGYAFDDQDVADMAALRDRFGVELPLEYRRRGAPHADTGPVTPP